MQLLGRPLHSDVLGLHRVMLSSAPMSCAFRATLRALTALGWVRIRQVLGSSWRVVVVGAQRRVGLGLPEGRRPFWTPILKLVVLFENAHTYIGLPLYGALGSAGSIMCAKR